MKYKMKIFKDKIFLFFKNIKNKIVPFVIKNKIILLIALIILIIFITSISIIKNKNAQLDNSNLDNLGYTVKNKGRIYYLGYNNGNIDGIYKMKLNGNKKEKISDDYGYYLNEDGNYIYYIDSKTNNLIKMKNNGKDKEVFVEKVDSAKMTVFKGWVYYFKNAKLYRLKTNWSKKQEILRKSVDRYEIIGNNIYYSYYSNDNYIIATMKTDGTNNSKINLDAGQIFFINKDKIFYLKEVKEQPNEGIQLYEMNLDGKEVKKIADIKGIVNLNSINFYKYYMYYIKEDKDNNLAIYKIKLNGESETKIIDIKGYSTLININDDYIYYPDENDNENMDIYRIKTNGEGKESLSL